MNIAVVAGKHGHRRALVFVLLVALSARGESGGSDPMSLRAENIDYDVLSKVQALSLDPGRLKTVERKIDPTFGVLVDEAAFPEEGAVATFLPDSGTLIAFRRDANKLPRGEDNQPMDKKTIHSKGVALLQGLGIESLTTGENRISEDDWAPSKSTTAPTGLQKDVPNDWRLSKQLSYHGIPCAGPLLAITLDSRSGKLLHFLYVPVTGIGDLEPKISSATATEAAVPFINQLEWKGMRYNDTRLVIAFPNNALSRKKGERLSFEFFDQRLAWEVKYSTTTSGRENPAFVYVDAKTGDVIGRVN